MIRKLKRIFFSMWAGKQLRRLHRACADPEKMYTRSWKSILKLSVSGPLASFDSYKDLNALRDLPMTAYEDYQEAFQKSLETKINPFTGENIHFWVNSTGTTGKYKTMPITDSVEREMQDFSSIRISQLIKAFNVLSSAPEIIFVLPGESQGENKSLPIGVIGYYHYKKMPSFLKKNFVFTKELYANEEHYNRWYLLMALLSDASGISTPVPVKITHFLNEINSKREELLQHLEKEDWPKELSQSVSPERIEMLKSLLQEPIKDVRKVWPSLSFVCVWMAGESCSRQVEELRQRYAFENVVFIDQVFRSSEGTFNIPLINEVGGPVNPFGIILEFYDTASDKFYWPWELEEGKCYELVLTNSMGLTRYKTNDQVVCTGYFNKMAKIAFHSRSPIEISLGWGTIEESELEWALIEAGISDFSEFYFQLNAKGTGVEWVSFNAKLESYLPAVEKHLASINPYYAGLRDKGVLSGIIFSNVNESTFYAKMKKNVHAKGLLMK